jgi:hypothetical protein
MKAAAIGMGSQSQSDFLSDRRRRRDRSHRGGRVVVRRRARGRLPGLDMPPPYASLCGLQVPLRQSEDRQHLPVKDGDGHACIRRRVLLPGRRWCEAGVVSARSRWLGPGVEVVGGGDPGQELFQVGAGDGLAVVAAAGVEAGSQVGEDVQPGHLGGGGDGPDPGGEPRGVVVTGSVRVFPGDDRAADRSLGGVVIVIPTSLLSLSRHPDNDNYPDVAVMPRSWPGRGISAGRGGGLAA